MNSSRLRLRAVVVSGLVAIAAATSACSSSSGGTFVLPSAEVSSAPIDTAGPTTTEAEPVSTTTRAAAPKASRAPKVPTAPKAVGASLKSVCNAVEPAVNTAVNDVIANSEPGERPALNRAFQKLATVSRTQANRAAKASLRAALRDLADASDDFRKVDDLATADKEGDAFQAAVRRTGAICGA